MGTENVYGHKMKSGNTCNREVMKRVKKNRKKRKDARRGKK